MKKKIIILFIILGSFIQGWSQVDSTVELDSLYSLRSIVRGREKMNIDLEIAKIFYKLDRDSLELYIEKLTSDLKGNQNILIEAYLEKFLSYICEDEMLLDSSIFHLRKSLELFRELDAYDDMGDIASSLGDNYLLLGNISSATEMFLQSLAFYESTKNREGIAKVYNNLGRLSFRNGYFNQAMDYFQSSLVLFEELSLRDKCYSIYNNIGITEYNLNNYRAALDMFTKAMDGFTILDDKNKLSAVGCNMALCYSELGQLDLAIEQLHQANAISIRYHDEVGIINNLINLAYCNRLYERYDSSIVQLDRSLSMAMQYDLKGLENEIYLEYSELSRQLSDYEKAYSYRIKYDSLREIVQDKDAQTRIEGLQMSYEHHIKEQELVQLRADQKMQSRLNNIFLLVIILALILVVILVYGSRSNRKNSSILKAKNHLLKDYNDRLIESEGSLKELNEDKNKLFSIVAHDIRNPIAAVEGFSELLYENFEKLNDTTRKEYILQIRQGASNTGELLENMLLWARSQMNKVNLVKREVQVSKLVAEGIAPVMSSLERKKLKITVDIKPNLMIVIDIDMIKAVIRNLVTNAVKFSFPGKTIEINAYIENRRAMIVISDKGVGITSEMLASLFSPLSPTTPGTAGETGSGLGLVICKDYVERNGGTISAASGPGLGSSFTMSFPVE